MDNTPPNVCCPACGDPVKPNWRICPVCESRLQAPVCPSYGEKLKETWRRCPECDFRLVCPACGNRFKDKNGVCPHCGSPPAIPQEQDPVFKDHVCGLEFVLIRGGTFQMGDTLNQGNEMEQRVHEVTLSDFYMTRFPITQSQWRVLMDDNPSNFRHPDNPVEQVTWTEACRYAEKLSDTTKTGVKFHLPTESQWEYAARGAGKDDLYAGGADIDSVAWYEGNSHGRSHPVGQKLPNALGLYDLSGNVWEWCQDTFHTDAYRQHKGLDPVITTSGPDRVIRGGSWNMDAWSARCARRFSFRFDFVGPALGFRLVMLPI